MFQKYITFVKNVTMRQLLSVLFLISMALSASAQTTPVYTPYDSYSQMWNTSNTYFNTVTSTTLGLQHDTITTTGSLTLQTGKWIAGAVATDTCLPAPLNGYGKITLACAGTKVTNNDSANVVPVQSFDGINWFPIPGTTPAHLVATSTTVPVVMGFLVGDKIARYYALQFTGLGSAGSLSVQAWYYFNKNFTYSKQ